MACGHAKFTGEPGVCVATSGPGAIHLLNGLYDAKLDHQPVVAIVGQQARAALGGDYQQEVDLLSLFKDVAHEYVHMASDPAQVRHLVDRALRIAMAERTPTCVIVPSDVQTLEAVEEPARAHGTVHSGIGHASPVVVPEVTRARACRGGAERRGSRRDPCRGRRAARNGRADRGRRGTRRRGGEGAARQGGPAGRSALRDRLDRAARHAAELGAHGRLRHAARRRLELSLLGISAARGTGTRRADRSRRAHALDPLSDGGQPRRRQRGDPARAAALSRSQDRPLLAGDDRGERRALARRAREARRGGGRPDQPSARVPRAFVAASGRLHPRCRLGVCRELVRPRRRPQTRDDGLAFGHARDNGLRRSLRRRCEVRALRPAGDRPRRATAPCR